MRSSPLLRLIRLSLALAPFVSAGRAQTYVGNLDGTHLSSTFTTATDGDNPVTNFGWLAVTGSTRVFGQSGGTTNDVLIGTDPFANYSVQFNTTSTPLLPNSTYTLTVRVGFVSGGVGGSASYELQMGTTTGGTNFTALAANTPSLATGTIVRNNPSNTAGLSIGADLNSSDLLTISFTTGASVSTGSDNIAVRLAQTASSGTALSDFFGFDQVTLSLASSAIPEPSTYAALFGASALVFAAWRRRRARSR